MIAGPEDMLPLGAALRIGNKEIAGSRAKTDCVKCLAE